MNHICRNLVIVFVIVFGATPYAKANLQDDFNTRKRLLTAEAERSFRPKTVGSTVELELSNGNRISAELMGSTAGSVVLRAGKVVKSLPHSAFASETKAMLFKDEYVAISVGRQLKKEFDTGVYDTNTPAELLVLVVPEIAYSPDAVEKSLEPWFALERPRSKDIVNHAHSLYDENIRNATYQLGRKLLVGDGIDKDVEKGAALLRSAKAAGSPAAMDLLAHCYYAGIGVERDLVQAHSLYFSAAQRGVTNAMVMLGRMFFDGEGCEKHPAKSKEWLSKAAESGSQDAAKYLAEFFSKQRQLNQNQMTSKSNLDKLFSEKTVAEKELKSNAGKLADAYVRNLIKTGVLKRADFVAYQGGLKLCAIYDCDYISQGGMHMTRNHYVAMTKNQETGEWTIDTFKDGFNGTISESDMIPFRRDWQEAEADYELIQRNWDRTVPITTVIKRLFP